MKEAILILFTAMVVIGLLPLVISLIGIGLASLFGCRQDGAQFRPCMVMGFNIGPALTKMMMMHWLGIASLPIAAIGAFGLIITGAVLIVMGLRS